MLVEAARRVETAAKETRALVNDGSVSCEELRDTLVVLRSAAGIVAAAQTSAAASVAGRERQGDGGVDLLASAGGLSRREARSQVRTAETLRQVPEARSAVESGRVTQANAKQLAAVVEKAGAEAVASDGGLLEKAESMRPDVFKREARRWCTERDRDHGASEHERQRSRRYLRIWDTDDGMVCIHGEFDTVSGQQIANRLRAAATRLHNARTHDANRHGATTGVGASRSFDQRMADALHQLSADAAGGDGAGRGYADICVVAHVDDYTAGLVGALPDGTKLPASVLDTLTANARLTGLIFDRCGKPIWRTESSRCATRSQRQILDAKWGGCFHCGANPATCQPHHIDPVSRGGPTRLDNLVPACWECHNLIHEHRWWILKRRDGNHTMHPPERTRHGPARAPDQQIYFRTEADPDPPDPHKPALSTRSDATTTSAPPSAPPPDATLGGPATFRPGPAPAKATLLGHDGDQVLEAPQRSGAEPLPELPRPANEARSAAARAPAARAAIASARAALRESQATR